MSKYYYDLHIHSCLSPCGDDDSTPNNIAGMGALNGLNIMALTDHNTAKNCPAFFAAAKRNGIVPVAGMELTTSEDIHVVCLFEFLEDAMSFDEYVDKKRIPIKNRPDIFGQQLILDGNDEVIGHEDNLLLSACDITVDEVGAVVRSYNGICYPAHIDRESNGILATLGFFPENSDFDCIEIHDGDKAQEIIDKHMLHDKMVIISSDAHYLWDIKEKCEYFELEDEPYSSALIRRRLFELLRDRSQD